MDVIRRRQAPQMVLQFSDFLNAHQWKYSFHSSAEVYKAPWAPYKLSVAIRPREPFDAPGELYTEIRLC